MHSHAAKKKIFFFYRAPVAFLVTSFSTQLCRVSSKCFCFVVLACIKFKLLCFSFPGCFVSCSKFNTKKVWDFFSRARNYCSTFLCFVLCLTYVSFLWFKFSLLFCLFFSVIYSTIAQFLRIDQPSRRY